MTGGKIKFMVKKIGAQLADDNDSLVSELDVGDIYLLDPANDFGWRMFNIDSAALNSVLQVNLS